MSAIQAARRALGLSGALLGLDTLQPRPLSIWALKRWRQALAPESTEEPANPLCLAVEGCERCARTEHHE